VALEAPAGGMSTRPSPTAEILFRFLDFSMLCRQENFPRAIFGASRPSMAMRAVSKQGAGLRSAPESFPRNPKTAPPFDSRSARSAARPSTTSCGFEDSETIPFPGPDSIFSSRCGAISGQLRLSLTMGPVSERGPLLPSGGELRAARSRNGDRVRPSARSSWGWDEAVPRPWFGRREGRAERAVSKRKGMGRLGAENDDRLR
jgi:hypothetical protein